MEDFGQVQLLIKDSDKLTYLLPSPFATFTYSREDMSLLFIAPHDRVIELPKTTSQLLFCWPNCIKALLGHPRFFVNQQLTPAEMPFLQPFVDSPADWQSLLKDLRQSVTITQDELQFIKLWPQLLAGSTPSNEAWQRQYERLARRYAGQSPTQIAKQMRLTRQLANDMTTETHVPTQAYADQSHYIRECRVLTGETPTYWQNLSGIFYFCDETPHIINNVNKE